MNQLDITLRLSIDAFLNGVSLAMGKEHVLTFNAQPDAQQSQVQELAPVAGANKIACITKLPTSFRYPVNQADELRSFIQGLFPADKRPFVKEEKPSKVDLAIKRIVITRWVNEVCIVSLFKTGTLLPQGSNGKLKQELLTALTDKLQPRR